MQIRKFSLFIIFISLLSAAFTCVESGYIPYIRPNSEDLPSSQLFTDPNCLAGCWHDLKPGETTNFQLETFLKTLDLPFSSSGKNDQDYQWYVRSDNKPNHYTLTAYTKDNLLRLIQLDGPFNLTLKQVTNQLGNPNYYSIVQSPSDVTGTIFLYMTIYYPELGLAFVIKYSNQSNTGDLFDLCMKDEDLIDRIYVTQLNPIEKILESLAAPNNQALQGVNTWSDYICSKEKYG